jgi:hypothetical protein
LFFEVTAGAVVLFLVGPARPSVSRWPATTIAFVYSAVTMAMILILPLFKAQPLLGPIFVQVDRFVPPDFPVLIIVPALCIDLLMQRSRNKKGTLSSQSSQANGFSAGSAGSASSAFQDPLANDWVLAAAIAVVFLVSFAAVQWPFADFLMTPWARNRVFVSNVMQYSIDPEMQARWYVLKTPDNLVRGFSMSLALAFVSARCGLWWGSWMSRVQR